MLTTPTRYEAPGVGAGRRGFEESHLDIGMGIAGTLLAYQHSGATVEFEHHLWRSPVTRT